MDSHSSLIIWLLASVGFLAAGLVLARGLAALSALLSRHQQVEQRTVIAEYAAPDTFSPAELGYVIDATFGSNELLATIAQLYAKDAVQLIGLLAGDFSIVASPAAEKLQVDDCESAVLGYVRSLPGGEVRWSELHSVISDTAGAQADFEDAVLGSLVAKGMLQRGALAGLLFRKRLGSAIAAVIVTAALILPLRIQAHHAAMTTGLSNGYAALDDDTNLLLIALASLVVWLLSFMYVNLLAYVYLRRDGEPTGATDDLRSLWPEIAGFRLFLKETEFVRLQHDRNPRDPAMAYCLALGVDPGFIQSLSSESR